MVGSTSCAPESDPVGSAPSLIALSSRYIVGCSRRSSLHALRLAGRHADQLLFEVRVDYAGLHVLNLPKLQSVRPLGLRTSKAAKVRKILRGLVRLGQRLLRHSAPTAKRSGNPQVDCNHGQTGRCGADKGRDGRNLADVREGERLCRPANRRDSARVANENW